LGNIKSAVKRARTSEQKRLRNKAVKSQVKTGVTKAEKLIFSGETDPAKEAVTAATGSLDRAASKGIIHANNAARRKSRLVKKLNQAVLSGGKKAKEKADEKAEEVA